ncbi:hypothetical protein DPMN_144261 [Dreissena polymorpha]|uniref:Uncharacterized protein n=1 Tax=Dreissena polymorpha TaxID=45954 RepID=A0A9D4GIL1_DREPO|nr:hypothetical protein DPMN_144261 [Dreissena polymorpha]
MWSVLASCVTVVMFMASLAVEPSCPVCSTYEYEVRLLERVLSNEMALTNTLNKITKTHAKVEDSLKAIQAENVKLNTAMYSLEVKKQDINNKVDGFIDAGIRNLTETHAKVDDSLKAMQAENLKLNNTIHNLEVKKQDLNNKVDGFIDVGIRNLTGNVKQMSTMVLSFVAQTSKELDTMKVTQFCFKSVLS